MTAQPSLLSTMMSSSFEEPFDMLAACHRRVVHMLGLLARLGEHLEQSGADTSARQAARDLMRFFDLAAVHHHNDEELHIVPRLRRLGRDVLAQRLLDEHRALNRQWTRIRDGLRKLSEHADGLREGRAARQADWQRFADDYRAHIALEEQEVFPLVKASVEARSSPTIG